MTVLFFPDLGRLYSLGSLKKLRRRGPVAVTSRAQLRTTDLWLRICLCTDNLVSMAFKVDNRTPLLAQEMVPMQGQLAEDHNQHTWVFSHRLLYPFLRSGSYQRIDPSAVLLWQLLNMRTRMTKENVADLPR